MTSIYFGCVLYKGWALVYLKRYQEACKEIERRKKLHAELKAPIFPNQFRDDDEALFRLYLKLNVFKQAKEYREILKSAYKFDEAKLKKLKDEADQDIILNRQR